MWHKSHKMKDLLHEKAVWQREIELQTIEALDKIFQDNMQALNNTPKTEVLYPIVRPLLSWLEAFLYVKPEWQQGLGMLINDLDSQYGTKIPGREE